MQDPRTARRQRSALQQRLAFVAGCLLITACPSLMAAPITAATNAHNTFQADAFPGLTDGRELSVDQAGTVAISAGIEYPGFGLGTYDVDLSADGLTMTLLADPNDLGVAIYDDQTFDRYYIEFNRPLATAALTSTTNAGFSATVEVLAPGTALTFDGVLGFPGVDPNLPTSLDLANGGLLITIGSGTNLFDVGQGGTLSVTFTSVPEPAMLPAFAFALIALFVRGRTRGHGRARSHRQARR